MTISERAGPPPLSRASQYDRLTSEICAVVEGETNLIARMATVAALLAAEFEHFSWTGFYLVDEFRPGQLVIGPYQGGLGCLRIDFGKGVCGVAAASRETTIVADVDAFPGHIACDTRSRSEIVAPVLDSHGNLIAVLDVDSYFPAAFSEIDARGLEEILFRVFAG